MLPFFRRTAACACSSTMPPKPVQRTVRASIQIKAFRFKEIPLPLKDYIRGVTGAQPLKNGKVEARSTRRRLVVHGIGIWSVAQQLLQLTFQILNLRLLSGDRFL